MWTVRRAWASLLTTVTLLPAVTAAQETRPPAPVVAQAPSMNPAAQALWRDTEEAVELAGGLPVHLDKATLREGEALVINIDVPREGYLNVVTIAADGEATVLFPNRFDGNNRVQAGTLSVPTPRMSFDIKARAPYGRSLIAAFLSQTPLNFYALGEGARDASGVLQEQFARLSPRAKGSLEGLTAKNLAVVPRKAPLLAGKAVVLICAPTGLCKSESASAGTAGVPELGDAVVPGILLEPEDKSLEERIATPRPIYDKGLRLTKASEGFVPRLYNDAARFCTIAYGHLVKRSPCDGAEPADFLDGITEPEGSTLLVKDMGRAQRAVMSLVKIDLTEGQYAALCDFTFNVGSGNVAKSTLLKAVNARQFDRVPFQLRRWVKAGGREFAGLKKRREREIALFFEGQAIPKAAPTGEDESPIDIRQGEAKY